MLKDTLKSAQIVQHGDFILSSGKKSDYYVNVKRASSDPKILREMAKEISKYVTGEKLACMALGAVPLAVAVALETNRPYVIVRKDQKEHGTMDKIEGEVELGGLYLVIEDVATTGASAMRVIEALRTKGAGAKRVVTVVDREEGATEFLQQNGIEMISLFKAKELV
ncbi:MAG TPA: orotate phosphoribosyltransferase [Thermoplasmata archaeon]|nr:orotate phosphoribosyltransferase [Thermoplasmata archaeon]